jgi:hypothetical protein
MASKISKTMGEQLVKALANPSYEMVGARTNTERAMIERGLVFHGRLREPVKDARGHQVRTHGVMLTDEGATEAKRLAAEQAEERAEEPQAAEVTREDVARGVEDALQWLHYGDRDAARAQGAVRVLTVEFTRARRVMRKLLGSNRYAVEAQAVEYYGRVRALLAAAKRFEQEDAAQEAAEEGSKVEQQQEQEQEQAEERTGVTRAFRVIEEGSFKGQYDRTPHLEVDGGQRYRLVPFAPDGVIEEPGQVLAFNAHTSMPSLRDRYAVGTVNGERVAWEVDGYTWERFGKYEVRTEQRGEHIVAVYVKGSGNDIAGIQRASANYARHRVSFAPGCKAGSVSGGGEGRSAGAVWISQDTHVVKPLPARQD